MNKKLQNKLYEKYPKIFAQKDLPMTQTCMCWGISCGDGWYNIIDTLCSHLQCLVDDPHEQIEMYQRYINEEAATNHSQKEMEGGHIPTSTEKIKTYQKYIEDWKNKIIPQLEAVQVKEKYGGLRFYLNGYPVQPEIDSKVTAYINFAESISCITCEYCGAPGKQHGNHWIVTLCDDCITQYEKDKAEKIQEWRQLKLPFKEKK